MSRRIGLCLLASALLIFPPRVLAGNHALSDDALDAEYDAAVAFVKQQDYDAAYETFRKLSAHEQHDAQYNLATLLRAGVRASAGFSGGALLGLAFAFGRSGQGRCAG